MGSKGHCRDPDRVRADLNRDGFGVVHDLFTPADVGEVEHLIDDLSGRLQALMRDRPNLPFAGDMQPLHAATQQDEATHPDQFEIKYAASFEPRLLKTRMFRQCASFARAIGGNVSRSFDHAIIKSARNLSVTPWHQDVAFNSFGAFRRAIEPTRLHFWIPLQDVSADNGCMEFIAGSQLEPLIHHDRYMRKSGDAGFAAGLIDESRRIACPVPVGGATLHTPHTLHYCGRNMSDKPRKAWVIQFSRFGQCQMALRGLGGGVPNPLS